MTSPDGQPEDLSITPHGPSPSPGPSRLGRVASLPFVAVILLYRLLLSPIMGGQCRFEPSCSRYGLEAYRRHGPIRGAWLTIGRIFRCQPFTKGGYDPVPLWGMPREPTIVAQGGMAEQGESGTCEDSPS